MPCSGPVPEAAGAGGPSRIGTGGRDALDVRGHVCVAAHAQQRERPVEVRPLQGRVARRGVGRRAHRAGLGQLLDPVDAEAGEAGEDVGVVLGEGRGGVLVARRGVVEVDRQAVDKVAVEPAMPHQPPEAARTQLRVGEVVEVVLHGRGGDARGLQHERGLLARAAGAPLGEGGFELVLVRAAALEGLEAGIVGPLGAADGVRERAPLLVVAGGDGDPAVVVDGGEDAARRRAGAAVAVAVRLLAAERDLPDVRPEAGDGGLELRDVDPLSGAATLAVQQRADDRRHGVVARDVVG